MISGPRSTRPTTILYNHTTTIIYIIYTLSAFIDSQRMDSSVSKRRQLLTLDILTAVNHSLKIDSSLSKRR